MGISQSVSQRLDPPSAPVVSKATQPKASLKALGELTKRVSALALLKWALVVATAVLVGACFGGMYGLAFGIVGAVLASYLSKPTRAASVVVPGITTAVASSQKQLSNPRTPPAMKPSQYPLHSKEHNIEVFNQTLDVIQNGNWIDQELHQQTLREATLVEPRIIKRPDPKAPVTTRFVIEPITTYAMTKKLVDAGGRPLVFDMANETVPGGGVLNGARAQEETICRQTNLYPPLKMLQYPIEQHGGAYVPSVQFFRNDNYQFVEPFIADIFVSAAYDRNRAHKDNPYAEISDDAYAFGTKAKIRTMLRFALEKGHRELVLSAFGCGAFKNDPGTMADFYREIFNEPEFKGAFDTVAFGIYDSQGANGDNYKIFRNTKWPS